MKLLLTSGGIGNRSLQTALLSLVSKPASQAKLLFCTTAANAEVGDKDWLLKDLNDLSSLGWYEFDIIDFASLPQELWLPRFEAVDVLVFSGGNTFHLMHTLRNSGVADRLPSLLETKVYVGVSAGSIVATPSLETSLSEKLYAEQYSERVADEALGLVPFFVRPHVGNPHFPKVTFEFVEELSRGLNGEVYALDDQSAVQVVDGKVEVISEGSWKKFN